MNALIQYHSIKEKYPDALLLFRIGDHYHCVNKDALLAAAVLGLILKKIEYNNKKIDYTSFPFLSLDGYLQKLVRAGHRVALCEELEDIREKKAG